MLEASRAAGIVISSDFGDRLYSPAGSALFRFRPLPLGIWGITIAGAIAMFCAEEGLKCLRLRSLGHAMIDAQVARERICGQTG